MAIKSETLKISINDELFKALDNLTGVCVLNALNKYKILTKLNNKEQVNNYEKLCNKYYKFCKYNLKEDKTIKDNIKRCTECFKKFILEDLIVISEK